MKDAALLLSSRSEAAPPLPDERPVDYAARLGAAFCREQAAERRRELGQFFTPAEVARFMARLARPGRRTRYVLEPGAGSGVLACALLEELEAATLPVHVDAYEVDEDLARLCEASLTHAQAWLSERGVRVTFEVHRKDFVTETAHFLSDTLFDLLPPRLYDVAILNPPYFKLSKTDPRARAASEVVHGQPNIYAIFMAIAARLLADRGVMVSITPRSFTTGDYFRLFRQYLFSKVTPSAVHLFESRSDAFQKDAVLQENVILRATKVPAASVKTVRVTTSSGTVDLGKRKGRAVPAASVLDMSARDLVFHIPADDVDDDVLRFVRAWPETLRSLGLSVSTGPVVAFRARAHLVDKPDGKKVAPLLWLNHVKPMQVSWPSPSSTKPQFIADSEETQKLLVPRADYVVLRRFSAKEETRRLVAAPLFGDELPSSAIGLENHLNYIYRSPGTLSREEAVGLAAVLSSSLLDRYFRLSNGNTQVNATELRAIPLPSQGQIVAIGRELLRSGRLSEAEDVVTKMLSIPAEIVAEETLAFG